MASTLLVPDEDMAYGRVKEWVISRQNRASWQSKNYFYSLSFKAIH
jgi:hypothetical protein